MKLTGQQYEDFETALQSAFPSLPALKRMVRHGLDQNLDAIAGGGDLTDVVFNLVGWAETYDRVSDLLQAALAENPEHLDLKALVQTLGVGKILPPSLPDDLSETYHFDLSMQDEVFWEARMSMTTQGQRVCGYAVPCADDLFLTNLCDRVRFHLVRDRTDVTPRLLLNPGMVNPKDVVSKLARYQPTLRIKNLVCVVFVATSDQTIIEEFWTAVRGAFRQATNNWLVLILAVAPAIALPEGIVLFPPPQFQRKDIFRWAYQLAGHLGWQPNDQFATAWSEELAQKATDSSGLLDVGWVYEELSKTLKELKMDAASVRAALEQRINHAITTSP